jgi:hypothetical protein
VRSNRINLEPDVYKRYHRVKKHFALSCYMYKRTHSDTDRGQGIKLMRGTVSLLQLVASAGVLLVLVGAVLFQLSLVGLLDRVQPKQQKSREHKALTRTHSKV